MSRGRKILVGVFTAIAMTCGLLAWFVNWSNSDSGQQTLREVETQQAVASATAESISATATAEVAHAEEIISDAELIYENTFEDGVKILTPSGEEIEPYYRNGIPEVTVAFNGFTLLPISENLDGFIAELDCMASGAFCGIAYNITLDSEGNTRFFASGVGDSSQYFFDDLSTPVSSTTWKQKSFAPSSAGGFLNRLRVERFNQAMRFYVNGKLMDERVIDKPEGASGDVALYFGKATGKSGIQYVQFDNFRVWKLP